MKVEAVLKSLKGLGTIKFKRIDSCVKRGGLWIIKGVV